MDVEDLMDSDQRILAHSNRAGNRMSFDFGEGFGPPLVAQFDEVNFGTISYWCNLVRGEYSARKDRQEAEKNRAAATVRSAPVEADPPAGNSGGSGLPVAANVEGVKAAMAAGIESSLADLGRQRARLQSDIRTAEHELAALHRSLSDLDDLVGYYEGLKEKL